MSTPKSYSLVCLLGVMSLLLGCHSTYNVKQVKPEKLQREAEIMFVRADKRLPFRSIRHRMEVMYHRATHNAADLMKVEVGCRNTSGKEIVVYMRTAFFEQPLAADGSQMSVPVYETPWRRLVIPRGSTEGYSAICLKPEGTHHQVLISDFKR